MTGLSAPKHITKFCVLSPIGPIRNLGRYSNPRCIPYGAGVLLRYCSPQTQIPPESAAVRSRVPPAAYSTLHNENALPCTHSIAACEADLLIIDATNLACIAAADRAYLKPLNRGAKGNLHAVFADWLYFLRRVVRTRHAVAVFDEPKGAQTQPSRKAAALPAYLEQRGRKVTERMLSQSSMNAPGGAPSSKIASGGNNSLHGVAAGVGMHVVTAGGGWEADDVIGSMCSLLAPTEARADGDQSSEPQLRPPLRIIIASADSDMSALLTDSIGWLELLHRPSPSCPAGWSLHSAAKFAAEHGYPASARPELIALTGKSEAGIRGMGVSGATAKKLLKRYGSIAAARIAATRGELAAWSPAIRELLMTPTPAQLRRLVGNLAAASVCRDGSALDERGLHIVQIVLNDHCSVDGKIHSVEERTRSLPEANDLGCEPCGESLGEGEHLLTDKWPESAAGAAECCAWDQPGSKARLAAISGTVALLSAALSSRGIDHRVQCATVDGLTIDIAIFHSVPLVGGQPTSSCNRNYLGQQDGRSMRCAVVICAASDLSAQVFVGSGRVLAGEGNLVLKVKELSGRMQQHVGLVRRLCGVPVVCLSAERLAVALGSGCGSEEADEVSLQWLDDM